MTSPQSNDQQIKPSDERNGCFLDSMWCCKVCDGEIPDGHTNDCDIWKLEKKHRDFIANEYNSVLIERDRFRAALVAVAGARSDDEAYPYKRIAREALSALLVSKENAK